MKGHFLFLTLTSLLLAGCVGTVTSDIESTVQAAIATTLTVQPTETATRTPTHDVESTVHVAVAATLTAQPTETPTRMPTRKPTSTGISTPIPDVQGTVHAAVAATLTARPTETPTCTPTSEPTPTVRPPATKMPPLLAFSLETYKGQGFSFQYPANAQVKNVTPGAMPWQAVSPATAEIHVIGPEIWIKPGDADWSYRGPAYRLFVWTYENPEALNAEAWARNYILTSWREAKRLNRPWGGLPISEQGEIDEAKVGSSMIAGQPTFWVDYFGFYSNTIAYYLADGDQVIEVMFSSYPMRDHPLAGVQNDVYALILSTFRLEEP